MLQKTNKKTMDFLTTINTSTLSEANVVLEGGKRNRFAKFPLIQFTANKKIMGVLVNRHLTTVIASSIVSLVIALNIFLIYQTIF
jgi:manganese transport protein